MWWKQIYKSEEWPSHEIADWERQREVAHQHMSTSFAARIVVARKCHKDKLGRELLRRSRWNQEERVGDGSGRNEYRTADGGKRRSQAWKTSEHLLEVSRGEGGCQKSRIVEDSAGLRQRVKRRAETYESISRRSFDGEGDDESPSPPTSIKYKRQGARQEMDSGAEQRKAQSKLDTMRSLEADTDVAEVNLPVYLSYRRYDWWYVVFLVLIYELCGPVFLELTAFTALHAALKARWAGLARYPFQAGMHRRYRIPRQVSPRLLPKRISWKILLRATRVPIGHNL